MRTKKLASVVIAAGLGMLALGGVPRTAYASECGMGDVDWFSGERVLVSQADELLDAGQPKEAAKVIQSLWPRMHEARPVTGSLPHIAEGVRVMALASVRSSGDVPSASGWASDTAAERAANVRWGISRLRMLASASPDNRSAKVDLGEALSRVPGSEAEALALLEGVQAEHAITSAEGFAALARLRAAQGDVDGAADANAECFRTMFSIERCAPEPPEAPEGPKSTEPPRTASR
jgi:predicted Zn-dependent protease